MPLGRSISAVVVALAMLVMAVTPVGADSNSTLSADEAVVALREVAPAVTRASTPTVIAAGVYQPRLADEGSSLAIEGSNAIGAVAEDPAQGFTLDADAFKVVPLGLDGTATNATVVEGTTAVFANTSSGADTAIRPTATGVETFTQIRSAAAPETYSWRVDLVGGQRLQRLADGSVVVLDDAGPDTPPPPAPPRNATPANVVGDGAPSSDQAITDPATQLTNARGDLVAAAGQTQGRIVAHISTPSASDSNGTEIPTVLSVAGDVVTMTVSHRQSTTSYPVIADPAWMSGANVYSGYSVSYDLPAARSVINDLDADGVERAVIVPQLFQRPPNRESRTALEALQSPFVRYIDDSKSLPVSGQTPVDQLSDCQSPNSTVQSYNNGIRDAGKHALQLGMRLVLKPHLDPVRYVDGNPTPLGSRTDIQGQPASEWWDNYKCAMLRYAKVAADAADAAGQLYSKVDIVVGTELTLMSDSNYDSGHWGLLVGYIKAAYPGMQVTFAANWDALTPGSDVTDLSTYFFKDLDYIGVDAYFYGTTNPGGPGPYQKAIDQASYQNIYDAWGGTTGTTYHANTTGFECPTAGGDNDPDLEHNYPGVAVECLHETYNRDVVFTEIGYPKNKSDAFQAAYAWWKDFIKATSGTERCWFRGFWPWAAYAGTGQAAFQIMGTGAETQMINNQNGPQRCQ